MNHELIGAKIQEMALILHIEACDIIRCNLVQYVLISAMPDFMKLPDTFSKCIHICIWFFFNLVALHSVLYEPTTCTRHSPQVKYFQILKCVGG